MKLLTFCTDIIPICSLDTQPRPTRFHALMCQWVVIVQSHNVNKEAELRHVGTLQLETLNHFTLPLSGLSLAQ